MSFRSACVGVVAAMAVLVSAPAAWAGPYRFDRAQGQPDGLDSVSAVSGASVLRAFTREPAHYACPTSRVWIGELDPDRSKGAYSLQPTAGSDYDASRSGQLAYAVGQGADGGHGPTVAVFCFARGGYPKASSVTGGFVIPPDAPVSRCTADSRHVATPFRCR